MHKLCMPWRAHMTAEALIAGAAQGLTYDDFIEDLRDPDVQGPLV